MLSNRKNLNSSCEVWCFIVEDPIERFLFRFYIATVYDSDVKSKLMVTYKHVFPIHIYLEYDMNKVLICICYYRLVTVATLAGFGSEELIGKGSFAKNGKRLTGIPCL